MRTGGRRKHSLFILIVFLMVILAGYGYIPQERSAVQQVRVNAGEVVVDANVTDSSGMPVRGLTQSDFEVFENGVKQQITSFRHIAANSPDTVQAAPLDKVPSDMLPFSPSYPRLISIVFDKVNMQASEAVRGASAASAYVTKYLPKDAQAAVLGIGTGIRVYQRFTNDHASLLTAIQGATTWQAPVPGDVSSEIQTALRSVPQGLIPNVNSDEDILAAAINADASMLARIPALYELRILLKFREIDRNVRGNWSLSGLLSIIEGQKIMPGRKSMILFSSGFVQPTGAGVYPVATDVRAVTGAANLAGVTIYTLNTTGMAIYDPDQDRQSARQVALRSGGTVGPDSSLGQLSRSVGLNTADNLMMLAEQTGGYAVSNTNDLVSGMGTLGANIAEYYVLTYMPANTVQDGKFRAISVKLKRSGLDIRARSGYYAFPETDRMPVLGFEAELLEAVYAKKPPQSFSLLVGGYSFPGSATATAATLLLQFPLSSFKFEKVSGSRSYKVKTDIMLLVRNVDGSVVHRLSRQYDFECQQEQLEATRQKGFSFCRRVALPSGRYVLEAAVRDRTTGKVAVTKGKFDVAQPDDGDLQLSDIVLSSNPPRVINPDRGTSDGGADTISANGRNVDPDLTAAYRKSSDKTMIVYFRTRTLMTLMPIQCTLDLVRDGARELQLQRSLDASLDSTVPCLFEIGLDQLKPGKYELLVTVNDRHGSKSGKTLFVIAQ